MEMGLGLDAPARCKQLDVVSTEPWLLVPLEGSELTREDNGERDANHIDDFGVTDTIWF